MTLIPIFRGSIKEQLVRIRLRLAKIGALMEELRRLVR